MPKTASPVLVILGGAGDLALRMLLPSLSNLEADDVLPKGLRIIAVGRGQGDAESYRAEVRAALEKRGEFEDKAWKALAPRLDYCPADVTRADGVRKLAAQIGEHSLLVIYFAVSPSIFEPACRELTAAGLTGPQTRLVLEKPIGRDLESSQAINATLAEAAPEEQVFRIDHYLGKETVQNLIALRFANTLFEPLWTNLTIDHVQITVAETQGVGDRWPYYDEYGALRDMLQNHMLQLLCFVAMEPPSDMNPDAVRNEKVKVLRSLRPITRPDVVANTVRGQYTAGSVEGRPATGYLDEVGRLSGTETFVAVTAHIDNWRWAGTPFFLRTGKRMPERRTEIVIQFKPVPHSIFDGAAEQDLVANRLVIELQPNEDISLTLMNKRPGLTQESMRLQPLPLSLSLARALGEEGGRRRIAYERLLLDVFRGDSTLFVRRDEVEEAWRWIDGVEAAWADAGMAPKPYPAGSWGPAGAFALIERTGRAWNG
ncbi:MAG TPA: glucose-6-phosphate dehydrogenase [Caulobacteraceae bacterium]|nr:glucose-6-phosphate dehydrogenase [Caulobacteraceae bacterium]